MFQKLLFLSIAFFVFTFFLAAQNVTFKIMDAETQEPIPMVTIQMNHFEGSITNSEGVFSINKDLLEKQNDSLTISCIGYKTKRILFSKNTDRKIFLKPETYELTEIFLSAKKYTAEEIIEKAKGYLEKNYKIEYQKSQIFMRQSGYSNMKNFKFLVIESTLDNINQKLLDDTFKDIKKKYIYLNETLADAVQKNQKESKLLIIKSLNIESKEELASEKKMQEDFMKIMTENFKSDSQLIFKTGIIRLDKTETIDSITKKMKKETSQEDRNKNITGYKINALNDMTTNLFIHKKSEVDFINNSNKYEFINRGYTTFNGDWVYKLEFFPKGNAKYKGILYIDVFNFAIVQAEFQGAKNIFENHFNMLGIKANTLTYKSLVQFQRANEKYVLKYYRLEKTDEVGIDRPFTVVEKNENVKGKSRINKVETHLNMHVINYNKTEIVFNPHTISNASAYENLKPNMSYETTHLTQYDNSFWDSYNILTPEKAIQELKIED